MVQLKETEVTMDGMVNLLFQFLMVQLKVKDNRKEANNTPYFNSLWCN